MYRGSSSYDWVSTRVLSLLQHLIMKKTYRDRALVETQPLFMITLLAP